MRGRTFLIRYADDFVMGFASQQDARRVMEVLPKRFGSPARRKPASPAASAAQ